MKVTILPAYCHHRRVIRILSTAPPAVTCAPDDPASIKCRRLVIGWPECPRIVQSPVCAGLGAIGGFFDKLIALSSEVSRTTWDI